MITEQYLSEKLEEALDNVSKAKPVTTIPAPSKSDFFDELYYRTFYVIIKVHDSKKGETVECLSWNDLRSELMSKYSWYFRYRAALLQVKYPKLRVEFNSGAVPAQGKSYEQLLQNKIRAKKSKITQVKNNFLGYKTEFIAYKNSYSKLFDIKLEAEYQEYLKNIALFENKIQKLESELSEYMQSHIKS